MAPKRKKVVHGTSPIIRSAEKVKKKYRKPPSPRKDKLNRTRRALYDVKVKKLTVNKASVLHNLSYSYLYRRVTGETQLDARNGPAPVFSSTEEAELANYLSEMAQRGMGLRPCEFLDLVQEIVQKEKRITPFNKDRPSYEWYKKFMDRNKHIIGMRREVLLEACRSRLTSEKLDTWYSKFRNFLVSKNLLDKPEQIWNADETGFQMGSKAGYVIGPCRDKFPNQVPHMSGSSTKARLTVMFSASASGAMMPPFYVYPDPTPKGVNPLSCSLPGGRVEYTEKGWMNSETFEKYLDHFEEHIITEKPVVLLIDSVGSHINRKIFSKALSHGIELYRIVPNATHLMQPLDKGVFGPLKQQWYKTVRKHNREQPGVTINKINFAEKLKDCYNEFYKPSTVVNSFRSSGIYPVNRTVIVDEQLKTNLTFSDSIEKESDKKIDETEQGKNAVGVHEEVFHAYESVLSTPVKQKYEQRVQEKYDVTGVSPGYDTYVLLKSKVKPILKEKADDVEPSTSTNKAGPEEGSALQLLADVATGLMKDKDNAPKSPKSHVSPVMKETLKLPEVTKKIIKRKSTLDELPDHLTSPECIRKLENKNLDKIRKFASREKRAKQAYLKAKSSCNVTHKKRSSAKMSAVINTVKGKSSINASKGKATVKSSKGVIGKRIETSIECDLSTDDEATCMVCEMTWSEDQTLMLGNTWVQCDACSGWLHVDCLPIGFDFDKSSDKFECHFCKI